MAQGYQRSVEDLRRDSERTRAGLADTVDQLRITVSETAADYRQRLSPDAIKGEVGDYFRTRGERLIDKARENPLQAAAIGAGLAYPLLGIVRSIPFPVLMVGAGLFLMGTKKGQSASRAVADKASDLADQVGEGADSLRRNIHDARDYASDQVAAARSAASVGVDNLKQSAAGIVGQVSDGAGALRDRAAALGNSLAARVDELKDESGAAIDTAAGATRQAASDAAFRAQGAASNLQDAATGAAANLQGAAGAAVDYGVQTASALRSGAAQAAERATAAIKETIQQNPLLVAGIGLALGGFVAACLPRSDVERGLMGGASDALQKRARDVASQGVEAAKQLASGVYGEVADRAQEEGLSADGLRGAAQGLGRKLRNVADNAATTAYELADEKAH